MINYMVYTIYRVNKELSCSFKSFLIIKHQKTEIHMISAASGEAAAANIGVEPANIFIQPGYGTSY